MEYLSLLSLGHVYVDQILVLCKAHISTSYIYFITVSLATCEGTGFCGIQVPDHATGKLRSSENRDAANPLYIYTRIKVLAHRRNVRMPKEI